MLRPVTGYENAGTDGFFVCRVLDVAGIEPNGAEGAPKISFAPSEYHQ